ncbi:hypothetical protein L1049_027507 [Liquidambar formosana]|uniref:Sulfotransferase n=1 Tax=Liquidambar formosana TaxID=63359 RepID=A0AAP0RHC9_LIQFO
MEPPQTQKNYKETISSLPRVDGIKLADHLYHYQGFWCDGTLLEGIMSAQDHFTAKPTDIFLCSAPKSGTTWLKALAFAFAIATRTHFDDSTTPLLTTNPHGCVPMLEFEFDLVPKCLKIPLFATHVPSTSLPQSIHSLGCKIVYICREPKDVSVSLWHFVRRTMF